MKLIRFRQDGTVKPGLLLNDRYHDVSALVTDYDEGFFASGGLERLRQLAETEPLPPAPDGVVLDSPIARPSKIVCIGLNYSDHAQETGATLPPEPVVFLKSTTALCGPYDDVLIPRGSEKTDWEVELALVIGRRARYVREEAAADYIAGYCLHNDLSERAFQLERSGTWDKGKGCDTFAPLGPWLVTPDEIADVNDLRLWLTVNGKRMQDGTTANLVFRVPFLIAYVSQFMTLLPGDVISTGTPAGVGLGMNPQVYLRPGDVMELGIDGLGVSRQTCVADAD